MDADLDRDLALLAGGPEKHPAWYWFKGTGFDTVSLADALPSADLPPFSTSIDAQHRWLDPIVEAKWGRFYEVIESARDGYVCELEYSSANAYGTTRAEARARALKAAMENTNVG